MKRFVVPLFLFLFLFLSVAIPITASAEDMPSETSEKAEVEETKSVTRHSFVLDGERIDYTATAGTLVIRGEEQEPLASVFYVAYTKNGVDDPASRPVTFSFNGGPGAAAVWVHLGAFGPKKVLADPEGMPLPPPGRLVDNPYSVLDVTDLVFIDPVSTGFSRPAPGVDAKRFHGLEADVESVGELIRLWIARNSRWASPKFLAGESYGTTRAAGLALHLQERYGMYLNGVVMISSVLNWINQEIDVGNDLAYAIHLPSYTAAAWYHGKLPEELGDLQTAVEQAERFALGEYASALVKGDWLSPPARERVAERVALLTGLSAEYVEASRLRIDIYRFCKELLRSEGKTIGRLDTRFTGYDLDSAGERFEFDPSMTAVDVGYVTMLNDYLRRELGYETDLVFKSLENVFPWKWEHFDNRYVNVAETLRAAMTRNPELEVLFTSGYYDLATPYFDTPYTVAHLGLPEELRENVDIEYYEAGHMMYIREADHRKFKRDVAEFILRASKTAPAAGGAGDR